MATCTRDKGAARMACNWWMLVLLLYAWRASAKQVINCTNEEATLVCRVSSGCVLSIENATFGHPEKSAPSDDCSRKVDASDCRTNASFVWRLCQKQRRCQFPVPEGRPTEKCKAVSAYVDINYSCTCVGCRALPTLPSGGVVYTSPYLTPGTTVEYTCHTGYNLVGPAKRTCGTEGAWSGIQPACSIPQKACPRSAHPLKPFGEQCFEFVPSVATRDEARADCASRNATLASDDTGVTRAFIEWQLSLQNVYNYIWLGRAEAATNSVTDTKSLNNATPAPRVANSATCQELFRDDTTSASWRLRNATCSYKNRYVCVYDVDPSVVNDIETRRQAYKTRAGIGVGVGLGLVLIIICVFCIVCRDRKVKEDLYSSAETVKDGNGVINMGSDDFDQDIYDDTVSPPEVPDHNLKYTEVHKERRTEPGHPNYDEVYSSTRDPPVPRYTAPNHNAYENVTIHNLVGSLKRKLSHPFRRVAGEPRARVGPGAKRQKPMPAPKPAIRRSALFHPSNVKTLPPVAKETNPPVTTERSKTMPPVGREGSQKDDVNSGHTQSTIEIIENEIYDADDNSEMLTEL